MYQQKLILFHVFGMIKWKQISKNLLKLKIQCLILNLLIFQNKRQLVSNAFIKIKS